MTLLHTQISVLDLLTQPWCLKGETHACFWIDKITPALVWFSRINMSEHCSYYSLVSWNAPVTLKRDSCWHFESCKRNHSKLFDVKCPIVKKRTEFFTAVVVKTSCMNASKNYFTELLNRWLQMYCLMPVTLFYNIVAIYFWSQLYFLNACRVYTQDTVKHCFCFYLPPNPPSVYI